MMKDDITSVLFSENQIQERIAEIAKQIEDDYRDVKGDIYCIGILKGAVVFYTDLMRRINLPVRFDFMIASSYGDETKSSGVVKILKDVDFDIAGCHVIVVEDIIDSGTTLDYLRQYLSNKQAASVKLCTLLSKPSRRKVEVPVDYCGFEVPDEFLVGYGLDYAGRYRNLPYIGILKPEIYTQNTK